jgi:hypothetical protein
MTSIDSGVVISSSTGSRRNFCRCGAGELARNVEGFEKWPGEINAVRVRINLAVTDPEQVDALLKSAWGLNFYLQRVVGQFSPSRNLRRIHRTAKARTIRDHCADSSNGSRIDDARHIESFFV